MRYIGIDPGPKQTAIATLQTNPTRLRGVIVRNELVLAFLEECKQSPNCRFGIEMIASYGMAVGASVFETCVWIGRYVQVLDPTPATLIYRSEVKMQLCQSTRAKDANIRQALIDMFGEPGRKANPGLTYGFSKDMWAALGVAVTLRAKHNPEGQPHEDRKLPAP